MRSALVPFFEGLCLLRFGAQVRVNLRLVGVVVGKGRVHLRQRQMANLSGDLFRNETHIVPLRDAANRDARPRNTGPTAANFGPSGDQAANLGHSRHCFQV